ncbi:MAG TPA: hypothetical protein DDW30_01280 [Clostridiales bacterium]|nr:hypothetical protein [Clostridiales bacterium]
MESIGRVTETSGERATVEIRRASACEGCHKNAEGGCAVCGLLGGEKSRMLRAKVRNEIGARVGDTVRVESPDGKTLLWAAVVFLLPLVLTAAGFGIACAVTDSTAWRAVGAAIGFVLCFAGLRVVSGVLGKRAPDATITEIIESGAKPEQPEEPEQSEEPKE